MREVAIGAVSIVAALWILAVAFAIAGRLFKLTKRQDWVGGMARVCATVVLLSP